MESQKLIKFTDGAEFIVKFPNVGQLMDIESMKIALTNGKYDMLSKSTIKLNLFQLDVVDAISYFSVLIPELGKTYGIKSWRDLDAKTAKQLSAVYVKQFIPWFKPLMDELTQVEEDEPTEAENS